jgi:hypothetical protein
MSLHPLTEVLRLADIEQLFGLRVEDSVQRRVLTACYSYLLRATLSGTIRGNVSRATVPENHPGV